MKTTLSQTQKGHKMQKPPHTQTNPNNNSHYYSVQVGQILNQPEFCWVVMLVTSPPGAVRWHIFMHIFDIHVFIICTYIRVDHLR